MYLSSSLLAYIPHIPFVCPILLFFSFSGLSSIFLLLLVLLFAYIVACGIVHIVAFDGL